MIGSSIVSFKSATLVRNSWPTQKARVLERHLRANEVYKLSFLFCYTIFAASPQSIRGHFEVELCADVIASAAARRSISVGGGGGAAAARRGVDGQKYFSKIHAKFHLSSKFS